MIPVGALVNALGIVLGGAAGLAFGSRLPTVCAGSSFRDWACA